MAPELVLRDLQRGMGGGKDHDDLGFKKLQKIIDREDDYRKLQFN